MKNIEFLSNKEIEEVPDGGGSGGGGSGGGSTTDDKKTIAILANGKKYTDILTATVLAHEKKCPILLTDTNNISKETMDELKRRGIGQIIISGGEQSVSKNVVNQLGDFDVVRYSGHNRYETAKEIARQVRLESGNTNEAVLVDGTNFPDGITVNSLASKFESPIHLTNPNTLTDITKKDISSWKIENILIAGGNKSVSDKIYKNLDVKNKERISGHSRYMTAVEISKRFDESKMIIKK